LPQEIPASQRDLGASSAASSLSPFQESNAPRQMAMKPGIDLESLRRIVGNDTEMLCDVVHDFVPYAQASIAEIRTAVAGSEAEQVKMVSHKLKGSASLMGAHQLVNVCAQFEAAVETNNWPRMKYLLSGLEGLMRDIETSSDAFLRTHQASYV
jgi:HPt (histidine-containing phosphotransfer) domain-containing protein